MLYFKPEDSKKLEELGLRSSHEYYYSPCNQDTPSNADWIVNEWCPKVTYNELATDDKYQRAFSTLDICELENARKLWPKPYNYRSELTFYILQSDEERIKSVVTHLMLHHPNRRRQDKDS